MRATIDQSGRVLIPKEIRDQAGIEAGAVEVYADGAGIRIEQVTDDSLTKGGGRLLIPPSGKVLAAEIVRVLRDAGQR